MRVNFCGELAPLHWGVQFCILIKQKSRYFAYVPGAKIFPLMGAEISLQKYWSHWYSTSLFVLAKMVWLTVAVLKGLRFSKVQKYRTSKIRTIGAVEENWSVGCRWQRLHVSSGGSVLMCSQRLHRQKNRATAFCQLSLLDGINTQIFWAAVKWLGFTTPTTRSLYPTSFHPVAVGSIPMQSNEYSVQI